MKKSKLSKFDKWYNEEFDNSNEIHDERKLMQIAWSECKRQILNELDGSHNCGSCDDYSYTSFGFIKEEVRDKIEEEF